MTRFATIVIDPPWPGERGGGGRGTQNHYESIPLDRMASTIISAPVWRPAPACIVLMWTTATNLPNAFPILADLGARYISAGVWAKPSMGMGQYWRIAAEHVLLGTIGDPGACLRACRAHREAIGQRNNLTNVIESARKPRRHSEKPDEFYERVERLFPGPRLDMFAREARPGWDAWGNQLDNETQTNERKEP